MSEINTTKFYQFLAQFRKNGETWADVADGKHGNGDGTVIKAEFRTFMNEEWNGEENGELTNDLINTFWKKIDTNTSASKISGTKLKNLNALDKNEIAKLDKTLEVYVAFDEFVSNNVKIPSVLESTGSQWKADVTEELGALLEKYIAGGCQGDLNTILSEALPGISNKCTAQYCAVEYQETLKSGILADYPEYKVADDSTLQSLILAYIGTVDSETDASTIKSEIKSILDAYFATAGLGEESPYDLEELGFDYDKVNDIQKTVVSKKLNDQIEAQMDNILAAIFPGMTIDGDSRTSFVEILKSLLATAQKDFINTLTVNDINKPISITLSGESSASGSSLVFNPLEYVTDDIKIPVIVQYYSTQVSTIVDKFAEELVTGIDSNSATLPVYDSSKGKIQLDRASAKELAVELNKVGKEFLNNYVASGKDLASLETELKNFLTDYVTGKGNQTVKDGFNSVQQQYGVFISDVELPDYKKDCIKQLAEFFLYNSSAKLGSVTITASNYENIVNAYKDGNQLYEDMETFIASIDTSNKLYALLDKAQEALAAEQRAQLAPSATAIGNIIPELINEKLAAIINGNASIHTEFGVDPKGNIVFQEDSVTTVYNNLKKAIKDKLKSTEEGKAALEAIGGDTVLDKLIQAAWIQTYNNYNSSTSNSAAGFVTQVMNNFQAIMNSIAKNPEYLDVYTMHTSYADTSLTGGLIHYDTNTTYGGDETIKYSGNITVDSDGAVHIANQNDDPDYQATMSALLTRLINKYSSLDSEFVTSVFREAQQKALKTAQGNVGDCPYGTGKNVGRVENSTKYWGGKDSRKGDDSKIHMDQLVQLTLYYFDKLLYAQMAA